MSEQEQLETCEDCGKAKPDVSKRECPYAMVVHDQIVMVVICDECENERYLNI